MDVIVTDLEGTLTSGSSWRGFRSYFKEHYSPLAYNLFFIRFLPRFPLMKLGLLDRRKTMTAWLQAEIGLMRGLPASDSTPWPSGWSSTKCGPSAAQMCCWNSIRSDFQERRSWWFPALTSPLWKPSPVR